LTTLQQRITSRCYLEAFDRNDALAYVRHQIAVVGGDPLHVFTDAALDAIHRATEGIPRLINQTCDHALVLACAGGVKPVDAAGIEEAWADLQQLPTPWSRAQGYADPTDEEQEDVIEFAAPQPSLAAAPRRDEAAEVYRLAQDDVIEFVSAAPRETAPPAEQTLDVIETHLAEWESDFTPVAKTEPEVELVLTPGRRDPFVEDFVEEELVVDRYAEADRTQGSRVQAYGYESQILSALAATRRTVHEATATTVAAPTTADERSAQRPQPHARFVKEPDPVEPEDTIIVPRRGPSDAEMIIVEDDPTIEGRPAPEATLVRNQDYGRMFARLRRGT
jgi:hypothetical protein